LVLQGESYRIGAACRRGCAARFARRGCAAWLRFFSWFWMSQTCYLRVRAPWSGPAAHSQWALHIAKKLCRMWNAAEPALGRLLHPGLQRDMAEPARFRSLEKFHVGERAELRDLRT
jgi:hypothetical protein